jgi:hypothetical protein
MAAPGYGQILGQETCVVRLNSLRTGSLNGGCDDAQHAALANLFLQCVIRLDVQKKLRRRDSDPASQPCREPQQPRSLGLDRGRPSKDKSTFELMLKAALDRTQLLLSVESMSQSSRSVTTGQSG